MTAAARRQLAALQQELARAGYIAEPGLAAALLLMLDLGRPLLLEGDAGVGKTEVAKVLATVRGTRLIRLQCYEGLDAHAAMYEWNYQRQLLAIKLLEHDERAVEDLAQKEQDIFSERYLLKRPLLEAISCDAAAGAADRRGRPRRRGVRGLPARAAVGLPAVDPGARHGARRQPAAGGDHVQRHARAVRRAAPALPVPVHRLPRLRQGAGDRAQEGAAARRPRWRSRSSPSCRRVRRMDLQKKPGIAETLDWTAALLRLGISVIDNGRRRAHHGNAQRPDQDA